MLMIPYFLHIFAPFYARSHCFIAYLSNIFLSKIEGVELQLFNSFVKLSTYKQWKWKILRASHCWGIPIIRMALWVPNIYNLFNPSGATESWIPTALALLNIELILLLADTILTKKLRREVLMFTNAYIVCSMILTAIFCCMVYCIYTNQCITMASYIVPITIIEIGIHAWMQNNAEQFIYENPERNVRPEIIS